MNFFINCVIGLTQRLYQTGEVLKSDIIPALSFRNSGVQKKVFFARRYRLNSENNFPNCRFPMNIDFIDGEENVMFMEVVIEV